MAQKSSQRIGDVHFYVPITRVDEEERMVYGYGTREDMKDSYGTVIDLESVKKCLPDYLKWRNIREMHQASAVGRADEITVDDVGVYLGVKVVDDQAWEKVKEQVYRGFSIGAKKDYQEGVRLFVKKISEFSLVDRPSNEGCDIDEYRIYGGDDMKVYPCGYADHEHQKEAEAKLWIEDTTRRLDAGETLEGLRPEFLVERNKAKETAVPEKKDVLVIDLKRYLGEEVWDAGIALNCLNELIYLWAKETSEDHPEAVSQAADLQVVIEKLKSFIASEILEVQVKEDYTPPQIVSLMAGIADDVMRKKSAKDMERIQGIHDHSVDMGARCTAVEKSEGAPDVQRLALLETENETLKTSTADVLRVFKELKIEIKDGEAVSDVITRMHVRITELEKEPEAPKGVTKVVPVTKEEDKGEEAPVTRLEETEEFKNADDITRAKLALKHQLEHPIIVGRI